MGNFFSILRKTQCKCKQLMLLATSDLWLVWILSMRFTALKNVMEDFRFQISDRLTDSTKHLTGSYTLLQKKRSMEICVSFWEECR